MKKIMFNGHHGLTYVLFLCGMSILAGCYPCRETIVERRVYVHDAHFGLLPRWTPEHIGIRFFGRRRGKP